MAAGHTGMAVREGVRRVLTEPFIQKAKVKVLDLVEASEQVKANLPVHRPREKRQPRALKMT